MERSGKLSYYGRLSATTLHQSKFWRSSKPKLFSSGFITHHIWLLYISLTHFLSLSVLLDVRMRQKGCTGLVRSDKDQRAASPCLLQAVSPRTLLLLSLPPTALFSLMHNEHRPEIFLHSHAQLSIPSPFPHPISSTYVYAYTHRHTFSHTSPLL